MNTLRLAEEMQVDQGTDGQTNNHVDGTSQDGPIFVVAAVTAAADDDDNDDDGDGLLSLPTILLISWIIKVRNI